MAGNKYVIVEGTAFDKSTPEGVIKVLLNFIHSNKRIRVFLGDTKTGRDRCEEFDTMGYVRRSGGRVPVPILLNNCKSMYGSPLLTSSIVRITVDKVDVYRHPKYHIGKVELKPSPFSSVPYGVFIDGSNHANFKTAEQARKWAQFIQGNTNSKS